jgi:ABC-type glycerol-3-phosphate transport system substrate-binding protein
VTLIATAALALTACGGNSGSSKTELKLYNDKGAWSPYFQQLGTMSKNQIGLSLKPVGYTDEDTYQAFIKASLRTNNKPDLFTWATGGQLQDIVKAGQVADTSSIWSDGIDKGYLPKGLEPYYTFEGKQYCVPLNVAYWVMFYNKKDFAAAGVAPPTDWNGLLADAAALKAKGFTPFYQTSVLFSFAWFQQLLIGTDPDLYNRLATGKAKYTDPGVVAVMQRWKSMIDDGYFADPGSKEQPADQMKSGKTAMALLGTWFNTSLTQVGMKSGSDYGMFVVPNVTAGRPKTTVAFESGPLCSLTKAPDPAASTKFLNWWVQPAAQTTWANSRDDVSANPTVTIADSGLNTIAQTATGNQAALANRYFDATPAPILTAALDAFGGFLADPSSYQKQLQTIQQAADEYWKSN